MKDGHKVYHERKLRVWREWRKLVDSGKMTPHEVAVKFNVTDTTVYVRVRQMRHYKLHKSI